MQRLVARERRASLHADLRAGTIAAVLINAHGGYKGGKVAMPSDFFPGLADATRRGRGQSSEEHALIMDMLASAYADGKAAVLVPDE